MLHFVDNPENKPCVDHINRNKLDNRLENLRWATYSENGINWTRPPSAKAAVTKGWIGYDKNKDNYLVSWREHGKIIRRYFKKKSDAEVYYNKHLEKF